MTSPIKYRRFHLRNSILPQANFTGTVEYVGMPQYRWKVHAMDPSATITRLRKETAPDGRIWTKYGAEVPLRHQDKFRLVFYLYD